MIKVSNFTVSENIDLSSEMALLNNSDTPFYSYLENKKQTKNIGSTTHIWREKTMDTATSTTVSQIEGFVAATGTYFNSTRAEKSNITQLFCKGVSISGSGEASTITGIDSLFADETNDRMVEIKFNVENSLINSTIITGTTTTAAQMRGLLSFCVTGNIVSGVVTGATAGQLMDVIKLIWDNGLSQDGLIVMANSAWKSAIDSWYVSQYTYNAEMSRFGLVARELNTNYGICNLMLNRWMPAGKVLVFNPKFVKLAYLRKPHLKMLGATGDSISGLIITELTLEVLNKNALAILGA